MPLIRPEETLEVKHRYPNLDALLPDERVLREASKDEVLASIQAERDRQARGNFEGGPDTPSATMVNLLFGYHSLLIPLETCVGTVVEGLSEAQRKTLADELLNGPQFLHALAEIGLARRLALVGFGIEMFFKFHGDKDVDMAVTRERLRFLIEVTNLKSEEWASPFGGFGPPPELDDRLIDNVVRKFDTKFGRAVEQGWDGPMWIALDYGKAQPLALGTVFAEALGRPDWPTTMATEVFRRRPKLHGVMYFVSSLGFPELVGGPVLVRANPGFLAGSNSG